MESAAGFRLGDVTVDVETDAADVLRWLTEFLDPSMETTAAGRGEVVIRCACSRDAYDALARDARTAALMPIPCFALDRKIVSRPGWRAEGVTVLADWDRECFYRLDPAGVDIVARSDTRRVRHGLMRVVREVLMTRRMVRGRVLDLHAAAFEVEGRAVLIAGEKRSGKTTLLCHVLASGTARLMANDRVLVDVETPPPVVHGIPTIVSIRADTSQLISMTEALPASMTPLELARRFQTSVAAKAPLAAIVFPTVTSDVGTWSMHRMSTAESLEKLRSSVFGIHRAEGTRTVFEELAGPSTPVHERDSLLRGLAEVTEVLRCRLGPRAYAIHAHALLRAIADERGTYERMPPQQVRP